MKKTSKKIISRYIVILFMTLCLLQNRTYVAGITLNRGSIMSWDENQPDKPEYSEDGRMVTFSNIYFGSYPQSEISAEKLTPAIIKASYDCYGDAWVDGIKYRRVSSRDTNNADNFGNSKYRYFKWERIKWRVLDNDGDSLFIMADNGLDCQNYHEVDDSVTWMNCSLRNWLNGAFYHTAFSRNERETVLLQRVDNSPYVNGSFTDDYVYIPSLEEVGNYGYGFSMTVKDPVPCRRILVTDYAYAMGAHIGDDNGNGQGEQCGWWWLRNPGTGSNALNYAALIGNRGAFVTYGRVKNNYETVVPVMHIKLSPRLWQDIDDGTSGSGGGESAKEPLRVDKTDMIRSTNVAAVTVSAAGGITSDYTYQWYFASSETGNGRPLGVMDYKALVWDGNTLYVDLKADDVPDSLYLYCKISDGRATVTSDRVLFSKVKKSQKIIYNDKEIKNGTIEYGATFNLKAECNGVLSKITYQSSNEQVVQVNKNGIVTAKNYGKAIITIKASDSIISEYGETIKEIPLKVVPKQVEILKVDEKKDIKGNILSVTVRWKKDGSADGFQYSVAYNKNFTHGMNGEMSRGRNTMKLSHIDVSKDRLYIRIRAYKKVNGKNSYGKWSGGYTLKL